MRADDARKQQAVRIGDSIRIDRGSTDKEGSLTPFGGRAKKDEKEDLRSEGSHSRMGLGRRRSGLFARISIDFDWIPLAMTASRDDRLEWSDAIVEWS